MKRRGDPQTAAGLLSRIYLGENRALHRLESADEELSLALRDDVDVHLKAFSAISRGVAVAVDAWPIASASELRKPRSQLLDFAVFEAADRYFDGPSDRDRLDYRVDHIISFLFVDLTIRTLASPAIIVHRRSCADPRLGI